MGGRDATRTSSWIARNPRAHGEQLVEYPERDVLMGRVSPEAAGWIALLDFLMLFLGATGETAMRSSRRRCERASVRQTGIARRFRSFKGGLLMCQKRGVEVSPEHQWGWPPKTITVAIGAMKTKIRQFRRQKMPVDMQLAVIDQWIGELNELKALIRGGGRL